MSRVDDDYPHKMHKILKNINVIVFGRDNKANIYIKEKIKPQERREPIPFCFISFFFEEGKIIDVKLNLKETDYKIILNQVRIEDTTLLTYYGLRRKTVTLKVFS